MRFLPWFPTSSSGGSGGVTAEDVTPVVAAVLASTFGNVDNTPDAQKPISAATQQALDAKADADAVAAVLAAKANAEDVEAQLATEVAALTAAKADVAQAAATQAQVDLLMAQVAALIAAQPEPPMTEAPEYLGGLQFDTKFTAGVAVNDDLKAYFSNCTDVFFVAGGPIPGLTTTLGVLAGTPVGFRARTWTTVRAIGPGGAREITFLTTVRPDLAAGAFGTPYATSYVGMAFTTPQDLIGVSNAIIRECTFSKRLQLRSCNNILVIDNTWTIDETDESIGDGIKFSQTGTGCHDIVIMHNTIRWAIKDGINISGDAGHNTNFFILNNQIEGCGNASGAGLGFEHLIYNWGGGVIQGNIFLDAPAGNDVSVRGNCIVKDNFFDGSLEAGVSYYPDHPAGSPSKLLIEGNVFARNTEAAVKLRTPDSGDEANLVAEVEVKNNVFSTDPDVVVNAGYSGVTLIGTAGVGVNGNTRVTEAVALGKFPPFTRGVRPGTPEPEPAIPPVAHTVTGGSATSGSATFTDYLTGDLLVAFVGASSTIDITVPAGWTAVAAERDEQAMTSGVFWRIAATDGADTLGDWGSGRPRYVRVRNVHPTAPIRQHAFQSSASGLATVANPGLSAVPSGNSLALSCVAIRANAEGVAPALRADATSLYARTITGGFHAAVGVSTTIPVTGWAALATGLTGGATNTLGAHSWVIEIEGVPGDAEAAPAADASVATLSALQSALAAVPSGLGRDWVIEVQPGNYGYLSLGSAYARGTTRVCIRGIRDGAWPVFTGIDMRNSNRVELAYLSVRGNVLDAWGFPQGSASASRGVFMTGAANARLHGLLIEDVIFGIEANNVTDSEISYCTVRSFAVDGIRLFRNSGVPVTDVHIHHCVVDVNAPTAKWPDLTALGVPYDLPATCAIDPRRSDQQGFWRNASSSVQTPGGASVTVTAAQKDGRHADCIQLAGYSENVKIEDCDLRTNNVYCHGIYLNNGDDGDGVSICTGIEYRRTRITSAHIHAMAFIGVDETTVVDQCLIRAWPGASWGVDLADGTADTVDSMRAGISTRENIMADINVTNTVVPATTSSYWMQDDKINATGLVRSDTAEPTGWATTAVALGLIGHEFAP